MSHGIEVQDKATKVHQLMQEASDKLCEALKIASELGEDHIVRQVSCATEDVALRRGRVMARLHQMGVEV